ncbi:MAG: translation initiation factor eIF-1A [Candidatus Micrarchaeota archaeon]|nr:translation initiation factor eIF-1A [Candidatus Micrarchaeota archaeon]
MKKKKEEEPFDHSKIRLPKEGELFGLVLSELGGARMLVYCSDGKERICRVPGRLRTFLWVKEGDVVLVKPWDIQSDERGDIIARYKPLEVAYLKEKGYLKDLPV